MSDAPQKPVFIDQMPDYQEAVKKVAVLAEYQAPLAAAAHELGLDKELAQTKAALDGLKVQAQVLTGQEKILAIQGAQIDRQADRTAKDLYVTGNAVTGVSAVTAGLLLRTIIKPQRWRITKILAIGIPTVIATALGWIGIGHKIMSGAKEEKTANDKSAAINKLQEDQVTYQALALQNSFIETMATRMLDQRKMLSGEEAEMKLVSIAPPKAPATMAEKYAPTPAASKAAAVVDEKASACAQAR
jgi:hypothetical protein